ncbi:OTU domain-containing protein [Agarilytica rhodophyticola]|uniref:OTU domain-containing protein n=1 Tax=Agarilytica rhodophyticola TaxID=1737490 RepID=UPI000B345659|nr:OTU domain-containing protein [Agarilytica rhodophyticola]
MFNNISHNPFKSLGRFNRQQATPSNNQPKADSTQTRKPLPKSDFNVNKMPADDNCIYHGLNEALGNNSDQQAVKGLKNFLRAYVNENRAELSTNPFFEGNDGVTALDQLLSPKGHWNNDQGDLLLYIAAQALGREIHVLEESDGQYNLKEAIPAHNKDLPGEDRRPATGQTQSPILFLQGKTREGHEHYDLLEPKAYRHSPTPAAAGKSTQANSSISLPEATKAYLPFIENKLLSNTALSEANLGELQGALKKLETLFDRYDSAVTQIDSSDKKNRFTQRLNRQSNPLTQARQTKHEVENELGAGGQKNFGVTRRGKRQDALKAINLINARIKAEVNQRQQQGESIDASLTDTMEQLSSKLQKPNFRHNAEQLKKDMSAVSTSVKSDTTRPVQGPSSEAARPTKEEFEAHNSPLVRATEKYEPFMKDKLMNGVNLKDASPAQLHQGLQKFQDMLDRYSEVTQQIDKGGRKNNAVQKKLREQKHQIENDLGDNTYKNLGIKHREGRLGTMRSMHLMYSRMTTELEAKTGDTGVTEESRELMGKISHKLDHPNFKIDSHQLHRSLAGILSRQEVGVEKPAIMKDIIDDAASAMSMFSSAGKGVNAKAWQSQEINNIVNDVQTKLDAIKSTLSPSLTESELVGKGIEANENIMRGYTKLAEYADGQLAKGNLNKETTEALTVLRDTSHLASQTHESAKESGIFLKGRLEFEDRLPLHARERKGTAPTPALERSSNTKGTVGVSAGWDLRKFGRATLSEDGESVRPHGLRASIKGAYTGARKKVAYVVRANDANLFSANVTNSSHKFGIDGGVAFKTKAVQGALGEINLGLTADGSVSYTKQTGSVALGSTPATVFGSHHAPKLLNGQAAGSRIGLLAKFTGIDDAFGTRKLNKVSEVTLKLGYNNDDQIADGFRALFGNNVETIYDRKGKGPLAETFTSPELKRSTVADGHETKGVMSQLLPSPLWESKEYQRETWEGRGSVKGSATADATGSIPFIPKFKVGAKAGIGGSYSVANTSRIVRSAKLPHEMFSPGLNLSPRRSMQYVQEYFSQASSADKTIAKPIANAMGFENTADYFKAITDSFGEGGPKIRNINSQQLTQRYNDFQKDVNLIDQFYLQPHNSIRQKQLPQVQAAIERINNNFGAQLPSIDESNISELQVATKKGYTENYQRFQDTSVAILGGFSAAGGAIKLMANERAENPQQKAMLTEAADSLLGSINDQAMPWNRKEMSNRATYVRQVVAPNFSHAVTTSLNAEARVFHGRHGGEYSVSGIADDGAGAILSANSPGTGFNVNQSKTTTTLPDTVTDPGQTGITRNTVTTHQKLTGPFRDFRKADTLKGKLREAALQLATSKQEIDYLQTRKKTQAYTAKPDDPIKRAREFTAYRSTATKEERSVGVNLSGAVPTPLPIKVNLGIGRTQGKNDYTLDGFTYGNDVGAMAIIGEKIFKDHDIDMKKVADFIAASQQEGGPVFDFIDRMDNRFAEGILGDKQYDHMSAILSKFRNAGFVEGSVDGQQSLKHPVLNDEGMATPVSEDQLHNSKGQPLDLSTDKKYIDRSGFFGYAIARYDEGLIQDAYKHWQSYEQPFPNISEIDGLLSKPVPAEIQHKDDNGQPIAQTRQQWLKSASMEQRKDFYQNDPEGQQMLFNYLKVLSFSASLNDVIFQNNSHRMMHDTEQVEHVNGLFAAPPQEPVDTIQRPLTQAEAQAILDDPKKMQELLNNPIDYTEEGLIAKEVPLPAGSSNRAADHIERDPARRRR